MDSKQESQHHQKESKIQSEKDVTEVDPSFVRVSELQAFKDLPTALTQEMFIPRKIAVTLEPRIHPDFSLQHTAYSLDASHADAFYLLARTFFTEAKDKKDGEEISLYKAGIICLRKAAAYGHPIFFIKELAKIPHFHKLIEAIEDEELKEIQQLIAQEKKAEGSAKKEIQKKIQDLVWRSPHKTETGDLIKGPNQDLIRKLNLSDSEELDPRLKLPPTERHNFDYTVFRLKNDPPPPRKFLQFNLGLIRRAIRGFPASPFASDQERKSAAKQMNDCHTVEDLAQWLKQSALWDTSKHTKLKDIIKNIILVNPENPEDPQVDDYPKQAIEWLDTLDSFIQEAPLSSSSSQSLSDSTVTTPYKKPEGERELKYSSSNFFYSPAPQISDEVLNSIKSAILLPKHQFFDVAENKEHIQAIKTLTSCSTEETIKQWLTEPKYWDASKHQKLENIFSADNQDLSKQASAFLGALKHSIPSTPSSSQSFSYSAGPRGDK